MNPLWLIRMARWARRPPSLRHVIIVLVTLGICLALVGFEHLWGWPDWLKVNGPLRMRP